MRVAFSRFKTFGREVFTSRMFGFALSRSWVFVVFFSSNLLIQSAQKDAILNTIFLYSICALVALLIVCGILNKKCESLIRSKIWCSLPAVFSLLGTSLLPVSDLGSPFGVFSLAVSAIATGIGSGLLILFWGRVYSRIGGPQTAAETSVAFILATLLVPFFVISPFLLQIIIVSVLPLGSVAILFHEIKLLDKTGSCEPGTDIEKPRWKLETVGLGWSRVLIKLAVSSIAFGIVVSIMTTVFSSLETVGFSFKLPLAAFIAGTITLCILFFCKRLDFAFSYRPVLILMSLACCILPFTHDNDVVVFVLSLSGYFSFEIMSWIMLADICFRFDLPAYQVFGFGRASVSGGVLIGAIIGRYLNESFVFTFEIYAAFALAMIFVMIVTYMFTLTERDVAIITRQRSRRPVQDHEEKRLFSIEEKVAVIAEQHNIGGRGVEVLTLLAKGRTGTRIEQELYMSKGTVNTHLRRLYQKLEIHTKQEFLDMLQAIKEE